MFKLLIVDDEAFIRRGIIKNINWQELGICSVEQADDGANALKLVQEYRPDIILTDIRMPVMDGIALADSLRKSNYDCKIIFMSAFSDKEYLKSAISLKVLSYVEKPIDLDEIKEAISHAVLLCKNEQSEKKAKSELENKLAENKLLSKNNLIQDLINPKSDLAYITSILHLTGSGFTVTGSYAVLVIRVKQPDALFAIKNNLLEKIEKALSESTEQIIAGYKTEDHIITVIHRAANEKLPLTDVLVESITRKISDLLKEECVFYVGAGMPVTGIENIHQSYHTAVLALQELFYKGYNNYSTSNSEERECYELDDDVISAFKKHLEKSDKDSVVEYVKSFTQKVKEFTATFPNYIKNVYFKLLLVVLEVGNQSIPDALQSDTQSFFWESMTRFEVIEEVEQYLLQKIDAFYSSKQETGSGNKIILSVKKIIEEEYSNPELSIKGISQSIFLSEAYLCVFFKKETQKTINQYVTEVRIQKAKELLENRKFKLYDVARSVGYNDHNYFTRTFKKMTGVTPSEYRERV